LKHNPVGRYELPRNNNPQ